MDPLRRRLALPALLSIISLAVLGCIETGEIRVRNATEGTLRVSAYSADVCSPFSVRPWVVIEGGGERDFLVTSGSLVGNACIGVSTTQGVAFSEVEFGRLYQVTEGDAAPEIQDIGEHDQPWYLDMQRWEWSWSSWWVWLYVVPVALGAPAGLFITARFFYRYYVLKQP